MKYSKLIIAASLLLTLGACNNTQTEETTVVTNDSPAATTSADKPADMHSAKTSLDWNGTYEGTLPCASCEGIKTSLTLNEDGTYARVDDYIGGKSPEKFEEKGSFTWDSTGSIVILESKETMKPMYFVKEGSIVMLDADGKENTGELADKYVLNKKK